MKNWIFLILLFSILFSVLSIRAEKKERNENKLGLVQRFLDKNSEKQMEIRHELATMMRKLKQEKDKSIFFTVLLIAFLYGIIHSLGPGHGKLLISSIFLTGKAKLGKGLLAGVIFAFSHSIAGLLLVIILQLLSKKVFQTSDQFVTIAQRISLYLLS